ncbi:MAG: nucleotidyltransferase family protein [Proteobacteria bacterium]|nr:nucleotidyltransferase family protein [Pseudomonadota bacterium]MBU2226769.1 nucleotidyltransferase family protein [Pseudomonadota bacterium]MBU2262413.1 nucleotidyltransferase family protein [Pseudomonadota bacterium]
MDILEELKRLVERLDEEKIQYALCGGLAMAIYALPRATLDIDIMIESDSLEKTSRAIDVLGFNLSAMPMEFHGGKVHIHRLSKIESGTGETLVLDLLIVTPEIRQAWESRTKVEWEGGTLSVVSAEGLVLLKSFRKSGQDQDDIQYLRSIIDED